MTRRGTKRKAPDQDIVPMKGTKVTKESHIRKDNGGATKARNHRFARRNVIVERFVDLAGYHYYKPTLLTGIVKDYELENVMNRTGVANVTMVREFFDNIDAKTLDSEGMEFQTTVRGKHIIVTPDSLSTLRDVKRPNADLSHFPFCDEVDELPDPKQVKDYLFLPDASKAKGKWLIRDLKKDFVIVHHAFWYNVLPTTPKRELSDEQANMLWAINHGYSPDVPKIWFNVLVRAYKGEHSRAKLPLALLLTDLMKSAGVKEIKGKDKLEGQAEPISISTVAQSQGQSKLHRKVKDPASLEGIAETLKVINEQQKVILNRQDVILRLLGKKKGPSRRSKNGDRD